MALLLQFGLLLGGRFVVVRCRWQKALNATGNHNNRGAETFALVEAHNPDLSHVRRDFRHRYGLNQI
jgi:hypothetical protein